MAEENEFQRFGIPSLSRGALRWFYGLFCSGSLYLTTTNTLGELARAGAADWLEVQTIVTEQLVRGAGASLIGAYILAEGGDMIISAILREQNRRKDLEERRIAVEGGRQEGLQEGRQEGRLEGRQEGRQEMQGLWETWNQRRQDAEERGERFTEPPPDFSNSNGPAS